MQQEINLLSKLPRSKRNVRPKKPSRSRANMASAILMGRASTAMADTATTAAGSPSPRTW
jgi:hypothetical protein